MSRQEAPSTIMQLVRSNADVIAALPERNLQAMDLARYLAEQEGCPYSVDQLARAIWRFRGKGGGLGLRAERRALVAQLIAEAGPDVRRKRNGSRAAAPATPPSPAPDRAAPPAPHGDSATIHASAPTIDVPPAPAPEATPLRAPADEAPPPEAVRDGTRPIGLTRSATIPADRHERSLK